MGSVNFTHSAGADLLDNSVVAEVPPNHMERTSRAVFPLEFRFRFDGEQTSYDTLPAGSESIEHLSNTVSGRQGSLSAKDLAWYLERLSWWPSIIFGDSLLRRYARIAFHELENEESRVVRFLQIVDGRNVRMIERCEKFGLTLKAAYSSCVA